MRALNIGDEAGILLLRLNQRVGSRSSHHLPLPHSPPTTLQRLRQHRINAPIMSMLPPSGPSKTKPRSPPLRPLGPNSLMTEITPTNLPPATAGTSPPNPSTPGPHELADAMSKIDNLRQKTPSTTAPTSPNASGASSPNPVGLPSAEKIVQAVQDARNGPGPVTGTPGGVTSVPGTPHFGAQTGL